MESNFYNPRIRSQYSNTSQAPPNSSQPNLNTSQAPPNSSQPNLNTSQAPLSSSQPNLNTSQAPHIGSQLYSNIFPNSSHTYSNTSQAPLSSSQPNPNTRQPPLSGLQQSSNIFPNSSQPNLNMSQASPNSSQGNLNTSQNYGGTKKRKFSKMKKSVRFEMTESLTQIVKELADINQQLKDEMEKCRKGRRLESIMRKFLIIGDDDSRNSINGIPLDKLSPRETAFYKEILTVLYDKK